METQITEKQHSVKLSRGMTGKYAWEVKIYFDDLRSPYKVIEDIEKVNETLLKKYGELK